MEETVRRTNAVFKDLGLNSSVENPMKKGGLSLGAVKQARGLSLPPLTATMQYGAGVRAEALASHGLGRMVLAVKRALKMEKPEDGRVTEKVLNRAVARMKRDTRKSLSDRFLDFRENLKFQYLFAIMEAASEALYTELSEGFRFFAEGMSATQGLLGETQAIKDKAGSDLSGMAARLSDLDQELAMIFRAIG